MTFTACSAKKKEEWDGLVDRTGPKGNVEASELEVIGGSVKEVPVRKETGSWTQCTTIATKGLTHTYPVPILLLSTSPLPLPKTPNENRVSDSTSLPLPI